MNRKPHRFLVLIFTAVFLCSGLSSQALASPWKKKEGYWDQLGGKFAFGLKHTLFSWTAWWTESREPEYKKEWEGFTVGIGKSVVYTAAGLIQLATFFIPVDFPDIGIGLHIPSKECPARHHPDYVPPVKTPKAPAPAAAQTSSPAAKPAVAPLVVPPAPKPLVVETKPAPPAETPVEAPVPPAAPVKAVPAAPALPIPPPIPVTAPAPPAPAAAKSAEPTEQEMADLEKELEMEDAAEEKQNQAQPAAKDTAETAPKENTEEEPASNG